MQVTTSNVQSSNSSVIHCANAKNTCGATIPIYLYSSDGSGSMFEKLIKSNFMQFKVNLLVKTRIKVEGIVKENKMVRLCVMRGHSVIMKMHRKGNFMN